MRASDVVPIVGPRTPSSDYPVLVSTTAPTSPHRGMAWMDISTTPPVLKVFNAGAWNPMGGTTGRFLSLTGGKMDARAIVDFSDGSALNLEIDEGRY